MNIKTALFSVIVPHVYILCWFCEFRNRIGSNWCDAVWVRAKDSLIPVVVPLRKVAEMTCPTSFGKLV